jgi:Phage integrase family
VASVVKRCSHANQAKCKCNWVVRWRDVDGNQKEKSYPHDRKTIASDLAKKVEGDKIAGVRTITSTVKFGPYAEKVIRQRTGAAGTRERYLGVLKNHLGDLAGRRLATVAQDRAGVKTLLLETLPAKGLGRAQIEICQVVITSTVMEAVREKEIPSHNLSAIRLPAKDNGESCDPEMVALATNAMIIKLADAMPAEWALTVWLGRGLGLRTSEARGIRVSDFSGDFSILTLARQVTSGTSTGPLKSRKPGETRVLPVPAYVAERVRKHVAEHETRDGYLFSGRRSAFVAESTFDTAWNAAKQAAGMPADFRFHDLRHTYASHMLAASIPVTDVSRWLGHKSIEVTFRVYSHFVPKSFDRAREFLDSEWTA